MIGRLNHVAIVVPDLATARVGYTDGGNGPAEGVKPC